MQWCISAIYISVLVALAAGSYVGTYPSYPYDYAHGHTHVAVPHPTPQQPEQPPRTRFLCHGKSIGNYADPINPCSSTFFSCVADGYPAEGLERLCPQQPKALFFSEEHDKCLERAFVKACVEKNDKAETEFEKFLRVNNNFAAECRDGKYEHPDAPCSHRYVLCDHGHIQVQECPFPDFLRFDSATQRCLEDRFVVSCQSAEKRVEASHQQPALGAEHVQCTHSDSTYFVPNPAEACSGHYFACVDGRAFAMKCPKNLFFDKISGDCLARQLCPACVQLVVSKTHVPVPVPVHSHGQGYPNPLSVSHTHQPTYYPQSTVQHSHSRVPSEHLVSPYGYPASHTHVQSAVTHHSHSIPAASPLATFNIATNGHSQVQHAHTLPVVSPSHAHVVPVQHTQTVLSHAHVDPYAAHPRNIEFVCWTKPNGNYSRGGCESTYYECAHGHLTVKPCHYGLFFNPQSRTCQTSELIATCDADVDLCRGRYDGIYAIDCHSYVYCNGGHGHITPCHAGEAFHSGEHRCMAKELCPAPCNA